MAEHPNAATARAALESFMKGDMEAFTATIGDDVVWHAPGSNRYAGDLHGKAEAMSRMGKMREAGIHLSFDIHDVLGNDEHVVVLAETTISNGAGDSVRGRQVQVMHVSEGKLREIWVYNEDQSAVDRILEG